MWEDLAAYDRLEVGSSPRTKGVSVSEDREKSVPEAHEGDDVEGHGFHPAADKDIGKDIGKDISATEEGPDVEGHGFHPKAHPAAEA